MMGDTTEDFNAIREHYRQKRASRRADGVADIRALEELPDPSGDADIMRYSVDELNPELQFRIDDVLDLYPTNYRFHNLKTGKRGFYPSRPQSEFIAFIDQQIAEAEGA